MSITRTEALNQMIELRDFAEQWEADMKPHCPPKTKLTFLCVYVVNALGAPNPQTPAAPVPSKP